MLKRSVQFIAAISLTFLMSCGASQRVTTSWVSEDLKEGSKYEKVFISVMSDDQAARNRVENAIQNQLSEWGLEAVKGSEAFPILFTAENKPNKEDLLKKVHEKGCDAIFTVALIDVKSEDRYIPPQTYSPLTPDFGYYNTFYGYYTYRYTVVYQPGYYRQDKTYIIESNLFDANTQGLVWTVQSTAFNPNSLKSWVKGYVRIMTKQMKKDGLIQ